MKNADKKDLSYVFDYLKEPVISVSEGESFTLATEDNLSGLIKKDDDLPFMENLKPYSDSFPQKHNPVTGPVFVKGAKKGDLLEVNIEKIVPNDYGITCIIPGIGPLSGSQKYP